jgi:ABC-type Fe3+-hydroxamate transport system substrate-binding protein
LMGMEGARRIAVVALVAAAGLLLASACSSSSETEHGTVRGRLMMVGGSNNSEIPVSGVITITDADGKKVVVKAVEGRFTARVRVGS